MYCEGRCASSKGGAARGGALESARCCEWMSATGGKGAAGETSTGRSAAEGGVLRREGEGAIVGKCLLGSGADEGRSAM